MIQGRRETVRDSEILRGRSYSNIFSDREDLGR